MQIVAVDIGGTHARFALAELMPGRVVALGEPVILKTAEHASLRAAWDCFAARLDRPAPRCAAIAVAGPIDGEVLKLTNNPWVIRPAQLASSLGLERYSLINDFGAVSHAVVQLEDEHLRHLCGPDLPLPTQGVISVVGPGTGLGVAQILRRDGRDFIIESEGGHIGFAPVDPIDDAILAHLRRRYPRVSSERVISGPGFAQLYEVLAVLERVAVMPTADERALWKAAIEGSEDLAARTLERFCLSLGSFAGDIALAHGASAVVIGGGLGLRLADVLPRSGFGTRFTAKGRFERRMAQIPVKLIVHPEPGLYGAAAAYVKEHLS
ncbi:glucokinase [Sinimarinibacterium thermocellulolyticum]|uniref:Glucokinase n=1 Tax=Sinimarinibacterium thermocellulolyticum TaxID=3170016 RepID=A0ABV2A8B7_9GAMM